MHWLLHVLGIDTQQSEFYDFWSGVGPCIITSLTLGSGVWAFIRSRNCEVKGCLRLGRHTTAAGHRVCRRHHPDGRLTADEIYAAHYEAARGRR